METLTTTVSESHSPKALVPALETHSESRVEINLKSSRRLSTKGIAVRLFITCWLVYTIHLSTNIVREIYPALALGDHFSFRVDDYANMHPDLFEKKGYGWHIGNNPGVSMLAAIPYFIARPAIDRAVEHVNTTRAASGVTEPPAYNSPWPMAQHFYKEAWRRGYDVKFGLAAFVIQALCMAPSSALGVVVMFYLLRRLFGSHKVALWLALLYAFGTPVFFRSGFLNHNLMLGHFAFMGFIAMWNPERSARWSTAKRYFLGGLAGGTALLFDYSGALLLLGLFAYGFVKRWNTASLRDAVRHGCWYVLGSLGPIALLWFYQWQSFGHPFYPGQHWMPPVQWIELGYQGVGWLQPELLLALAFDYRFGLFVTCPLLLLALYSPWVKGSARRQMPGLELAFLLLVFFSFWGFFSGVNYTRLQFNTGMRYMAPVLPFLFVPTAIVLMRLPRLVIYLVAVLSVALSWSMAMHRDVERGLGVLDPILHVFVGGFKLPAFTVLSRMGDQLGEYVAGGVSPLPLFVLAAAILYGVWAIRFPGFVKR